MFIIIAIFAFWGYLNFLDFQKPIGTLFFTVFLIIAITSYVLSRLGQYEKGVKVYMSGFLGLYLVARLTPNSAGVYGYATHTLIAVTLGGLFLESRWVTINNIFIYSFLLLLCWEQRVFLTFIDWILVAIPPPIIMGLVWSSQAIRQTSYRLIQQQTAALIESEQRFRALFGLTFQLVAIVSKDGIIVDTNTRTARLIDLPLHEITGRRLWELPFWEYSDLTPEQVKTAFLAVTQNEMAICTVTITPLVGKRRIFEVWMRPIHTSEGLPNLIVVDARNITRRKELEQARQIEGHRYRALFEQMSDGVLIISLDQYILMANPSAAAMLGYTSSELEGRSLMSLTAPEWQPTVEKRLTRLMNGENAQNVESQLVHHDGYSIPIRLSSYLVRDQHDKPLHIQVIFQDVTLLLREQQQELELMVERERVRLLSEFVTDVAHDLRTPLANIKTSTYLVRRMAEDEKRREEHLQVIDSASNTLDDIITNQLALVRETTLARVANQDYDPIDVNQLVAQILTHY